MIELIQAIKILLVFQKRKRLCVSISIQVKATFSFSNAFIDVMIIQKSFSLGCLRTLIEDERERSGSKKHFKLIQTIP